MSYAVVHMQKIKSPALKGMQIHHQREKESRTNFDIDESRTFLNYDLVNDEPINFNQRVHEIIAAQKTGTRKIRKDAVLVNELLVTSDASFFAPLSAAEQRTFFEESLTWFQARYGEQNIAYAWVHLDEKTPHMHVGIVPMRDGRLQGKNVFNRQELLWLQEAFPEHMQQQGFSLERGEKGSDREHIEMQKFKKITLQQQIDGLEQQLAEKEQLEQTLVEKKQELAAFSERIPSGEPIQIEVLGNEVRTKVKPKLFGHDEVLQKQTKNIVIAPEELAKVNHALQAAQRVQREYERLLTTDIVAQNHRLFDQVDALTAQTKQLVRENTELKSENRSLRAGMGRLLTEIESIYDATKTFLRARTSDSPSFKGLLNEFVAEVKQGFPNGMFEKRHQQEQTPKRDRGMER